MSDLFMDWFDYAYGDEDEENEEELEYEEEEDEEEEEVETLEAGCGDDCKTMVECDFDQYFDLEKEECVAYVLYFGQLEDLLRLQILPSPDREADQVAQDTEFTYQIVSVTSSTVTIQCYFAHPLKITTADVLQVQVQFSEFAWAMDETAQFEQNMTKQVPKGSIDTIKAAGNAAQAGATAAIAGAFIS